jgi:hypothetical protein
VSADLRRAGAGLAVFVALVAVPAWLPAVRRTAAAPPVLERPAHAKRCVEASSVMRERHGRLLIEWRDRVVREGRRTYRAADGREYAMSLGGTCLDCHDKPAAFCDRCHEYTGSVPDCWNCHVRPPEAP